MPVVILYEVFKKLRRDVTGMPVFVDVAQLPALLWPAPLLGLKYRVVLEIEPDQQDQRS